MKIKHNKLKNTVIIFECLVKQVTNDFINKDDSKALSIIKKFFKENTELKKELELYNNIVNSKINEEVKFINFIDEVIKKKTININNSKLNNEKYNIIKEIKDNYILEDFFSYNLNNYKLFASIYKLLDGIKLNESASDFVNLKFSIIRSIISNKKIDSSSINIKLLEQISNPVTKSMVTKILIEKFNEKFSNKLNNNQRKLLKEYINNAENKNTLKKYVISIIPSIKKQLVEIGKKHNKVTVIKLKEIISLLESINKLKVIEDKNIVAIMRIYELIDELKK